MIITRTPLRISLIGGGTDMPSFYKNHPGAVVSFAIDKYIYVSVNNKFEANYRVSYSQTENVETIDQIEHDLVRESLRLFRIHTGLEITSVADIPGTGSGLGSSSSFTVGLLKALGRDVPSQALAERAYVVEAEQCFHPVGKQDQYAAALGGMNYMTFYPNYVQARPVVMSEEWLEKFHSHTLLLWTGIARDANEILKGQNKSFLSGGNTEIGKQMANLANQFYIDLADEISMQDMGEYLNEAWLLKKFFSQSISNAKIEFLHDSAIQAGAYGAKLLGAGGGGFLFVVAPPDLHDGIIKKTGLRQIKFKIEQKGSQVIYESK